MTVPRGLRSRERPACDSDRGPDGSTLFVDGPVGPAHARITTIDLAGEDQPIHNEDNTAWVIFNGKIFNYVEFRAHLITFGHHFYAQSDTEVIVHLYKQYGEKFADHLNGQFAILLWDKKRQKPVLAGDRAGIRLLFYTSAAGHFIFASKVKALFALSKVGRTLDETAINQICTYWSPLATPTVVAAIESLPPGTSWT